MMKILYNVTIINKEIKIDRVVIIPNLFIGSKSVNEKLKNPTAVVVKLKIQVYLFFEFVV